MEDLKPCPFCEDDPVVVKKKQKDGREAHFIRCIDCEFEISWHFSLEGAINDWNTRPTEDALQEKIKKLEIEVKYRVGQAQSLVEKDYQERHETPGRFGGNTDKDWTY